MKSNRHLLYRQLKSLLVPNRLWKLITFDFIVKLLLSKDLLTGVEYNSILITTERLTKYVEFVLYLEASNAKAFAYTFLRVVVTQYKMLEEVISNRDKLFISKFLRTLIALLGVNYKLLTAFHP